MMGVKCMGEQKIAYRRHKWAVDGICGRCGATRNPKASPEMFRITFPPRIMKVAR
jgi:hypothetical protein